MPAAHFRVLLAENGFTETAVTLKSLCAETGRSLELMLVSNPSNLVRALRTYSPHVALLDLSLLRPDPPAAVRVLHESAPHIPLILFAQAADKDSATKCLEVGAKDFMLHGYMDTRTLDRVLHAAIDEPSPSALADASRDPLTGLANRSGLLLEAHRCLEARPLSATQLILSVRLQNLEEIQTIAGQLVAEALLREVARVLRQSVRCSDLVAHIAPGHFLLFALDVTETWRSAVHRRVVMRLWQFKEAHSIETQVFIHSEFLPAGSPADFLTLPLAEEAGIPLEAAAGCV